MKKESYKQRYLKRYQTTDDKYIVGRSYKHQFDGIFKVTNIIMPSQRTKTIYIQTDDVGSFMKSSRFDNLTSPYYITGIEPVIDKIEKHSKKHGYNSEHDKKHSAHEFILAAKAYIDRNPSLWPWESSSFKLESDVEDLTNAASMLAVAIKKFNN